MIRFQAIFSIGIATLVICGCAPRTYLVGEIARMIDTGMVAFEADDDLDLLEKAFPGDIKLLEALLANSPDDRELLTLLSRLYGSYAFSFLEPRFEHAELSLEGCESTAAILGQERSAPTRETLARYYRKGMDYGLRALEAAHPGWGKEIFNTSRRNDLVSSLNRSDTPALFWYGFSLGAYIRLNLDSVRAVSMAPLVQDAMERVVVLDPGYYHGLAHLVLLAYHARSPAIGGDPEAARYHYEGIKEAAGDDFLLADVYYARYYLFQKQDRAGFQSMLSSVLDRPRQQVPYALLNQVARVRARIYLDALDCLFI